MSSCRLKPGVVKVSEQTLPFTNQVVTAKHEWLADEPEDMGGADQGPAPFEMVLAGLGACTSMTMRMYAQHKKWSLDKVSVTLLHVKKGAADGKSDKFIRHIEIEGDLSDEQRERLLEIANKCPVHKSLTGALEIESKLL
ncbi:osmotically inducible protein OsmC [Aliidiomarina sedimenti]|uniref:Osmotically inducible protein OsmC n=1 Tax=Aliidiomarina sedimenti TaxID=1933879 RepID=A0ABY0C0N2_9GAMM|nr:osmotically inducible protein OsmC [Aliidiomarina sedimenti]